MPAAFFVVRATVPDPTKREAFDRWYQNEHLPDAERNRSARKRRGASGLPSAAEAGEATKRAASAANKIRHITQLENVRSICAALCRAFAFFCAYNSP